MRSYQPIVRLRFAIAVVVDSRRERSIAACPIIIRDKIEVVIKGALRLLPNDAEYLINSPSPCPNYCYISI